MGLSSAAEAIKKRGSNLGKVSVPSTGYKGESIGQAYVSRSKARSGGGSAPKKETPTAQTAKEVFSEKAQEKYNIEQTGSTLKVESGGRQAVVAPGAEVYAPTSATVNVPATVSAVKARTSVRPSQKQMILSDETIPDTNYIIKKPEHLGQQMQEKYESKIQTKKTEAIGLVAYGAQQRASGQKLRGTLVVVGGAAQYVGVSAFRGVSSPFIYPVRTIRGAGVAVSTVAFGSEKQRLALYGSIGREFSKDPIGASAELGGSILLFKGAGVAFKAAKAVPGTISNIKFRLWERSKTGARWSPDLGIEVEGGYALTESGQKVFIGPGKGYFKTKGLPVIEERTGAVLTETQLQIRPKDFDIYSKYKKPTMGETIKPSVQMEIVGYKRPPTPTFAKRTESGKLVSIESKGIQKSLLDYPTKTYIKTEIKPFKLKKELSMFKSKKGQVGLSRQRSRFKSDYGKSTIKLPSEGKIRSTPKVMETPLKITPKSGLALESAIVLSSVAKQSQLARQRASQISLQRQNVIAIQRARVTPIIDSSTTTIQLPKITQVPKSTQKIFTVQKDPTGAFLPTPTKGVFRPPKPPKPIPPKKPPIATFKLPNQRTILTKKAAFSIKIARPYKYTSSARAVLFNIRGKKPKFMGGGISLRPLGRL